ncbi:GIY-YIG nuclease family protein [Staphylococcus condimenti]|uniref:GIY-YIG nuclease family protein n=1 Tax=Staphylococcus condimenti TaxID=70255 RepID=A0AB37HBZ9_9STAP|nr:MULTISPECIES: GIY-YIG nuclease family protein [Staphylococcus]AMY05702.1 hypothetical protein A4G25_07075 [Staphylococcus condimenti]APR61909.1 hypothetical protein BTZ13_12105 [Staphylococcus condimenti]MDK8646255.1 GIY-YIG nuclease family protein [Staphylococcus condimenti]OFO99147.1 hypothetical protein HMPREF3007_06435 [Staphylococcus sp. HMSC065E08]PNZ57459.1 GIY-YIG nuclease family protein [Staphylococcus condimenti]
MENKYFIYIVRCRDGSLYTGYTNDVTARVEKHNAGKGAKYTKTRRPVKLVYQETFETKSEAMKREYQIKTYTRVQKLQLIERGVIS